MFIAEHSFDKFKSIIKILLNSKGEASPYSNDTFLVLKILLSAFARYLIS